jgi:hypothetical protein
LPPIQSLLVSLWRRHTQPASWGGCGLFDGLAHEPGAHGVQPVDVVVPGRAGRSQAASHHRIVTQSAARRRARFREAMGHAPSEFNGGVFVLIVGARVR